MTFPENPAQRSPKGDHNRRLSIGIEPDKFAAQAGVSIDELKRYEFTAPDQPFDLHIASKVGEALERLEATHSKMVENGDVPAVQSDRTAQSWPENNSTQKTDEF